MEVAGSRAETGSSARRISGSCIRARAIPTRCCCPPESSSARTYILSRRPYPLEALPRSLEVVFGEAAHEGPGGRRVAQATGQDVRQDGRALHEVEVLEDHPDAATDLPELRSLRVGDVRAVEEDPSRGRLDQAVDATQQGRLPRPGEADQDDELAAADGERDVAQGEDFAPLVNLREMLDDEMCVSHAYLPEKRGEKRSSSLPA